jgi:hypothetical protein
VSNADDIDDANVRQHARSGQFVNRRGADAELFGDLAHRQQPLDAARKSWQQIGSKISRSRCDRLRWLDDLGRLVSSSCNNLRIVRTRWEGVGAGWGASGRWFKSSRPDHRGAAASLLIRTLLRP